MPVPSSLVLTSPYYRTQIERVIKTLVKINSRPDPATKGRNIPRVDDIAFHDGWQF